MVFDDFSLCYLYLCSFECSDNILIIAIIDFDQFLAQRAAAEGQRSNSVKAGSQRPKQRQMQMENKDDDIFGLQRTARQLMSDQYTWTLPGYLELSSLKI